jgi:hypothetical protein
LTRLSAHAAAHLQAAHVVHYSMRVRAQRGRHMQHRHAAGARVCRGTFSGRAPGGMGCRPRQCAPAALTTSTGPWCRAGACCQSGSRPSPTAAG